MKASKKLNPAASNLDALAFEKALLVHKAIQEKATGVASEAGRLLGSYNFMAKTNAERLMQVRAMTENASITSTSKRVLKRVLASSDDASEINRIVMKTPWERSIDAAYEVYSNMILSGPLTHAVNVGSNTVTLTMAPSESFLAGMSAAARLDFQSAKTNFGEGLAKLSGIMTGMNDALRLASKRSVNKVGAPEALFQMHEIAKQSIKPAISSDALQIQGVLGQAVDFMGSLIRLPGNALLAEDKVFKLIHYRMETNAQAYRLASSRAGNSTERRLVYNALRNNPSEHITSKAIEMADYYTFTNQLGKWSNPVHKAIQATPMKWVLPFFKTPTNIIKMGIRNSAMGNVFYDLKNSLQMGAAGDLARAKIATGTLIPVTTIAMMGDRISGRVDKSTPDGQFKASQGIPPYSVRIGNDWYSYEKFEPFRSILGLYANIHDAYRNLSSVDPRTGEPNPMMDQVASVAIAPVVQTITDNYVLDVFGKTNYLLEALQSGNPEYALRSFQKFGVSMTVPSFVRQFNQTYLDNTFRLADTMAQQYMKVIPGLSDKLPPRRNLWGDPVIIPEGLGPDIISPIKTQAVAMDEYDAELIRLNVKLPESQPRTMTVEGRELELTPEQRDQLAIYRGKGVDGGPTLKEAIADYMKDPAYKITPDAIKRDNLEYILRVSQQNAKDLLFASDPDLQQQFQEKQEAWEKIRGLMR